MRIAYSNRQDFLSSFFAYICTMKKGYFISFFLPVFLMLAFAQAGNTAYNREQTNIASANNKTVTYKNGDQDQLPAILADRNLYAPFAFNPNKIIPKIISAKRMYFTGVNYSLLQFSGTIGPDELVQQKNYLFYIYPSHNFW